MFSRITRFIYHPSRVRILYDFVVSTASVSFLYLGFFLFNNSVNNPAAVFFFPLIYTLINYLYGIYSTYKLASTITKTVVISYAGITTLAVMYLFKADMLVVILSTVFSVILSLSARWFTNLPHQHIKSEYLTQIISENQPILVVGGGGYIGTHVVEQLLESGEKVRIFDKFYYNREVVKNLETNPNLEVIEGDISDLYSLTLALNNTKAVIHLAGIVGDPAAKIDEGLTRHINIVTTRMLKETVKAFKIPRFVFASSCSVYGSKQSIASETSKPNPVSLYAQTKIDSEKELLEDPADLFNPTILRFATVFGHSRRMRFDLVANLFCAQAYYDGHINVFGGAQWRPFVHVSDIARAIVKVIKAPIRDVNREIFNVGDNEMNITINDLAYLVADIIRKDHKGNNVKVVVQDNIDDPRNYNVSFDKIANKLDFKASTGFDRGIKEIQALMKLNKYQINYKNSLYSNFETTKAIQKEFHSKEFQEKHYSVIATQPR